MRNSRLTRSRGWWAGALLLACAACGGGGAVLPTETSTGGSGTDTGGGGPGTEPPSGGGGGGQPVSFTIIVDDDGFRPGSVTVPIGSTVTWMVADGRHDVTFIGRTPSGGSIPETREEDSASRTFHEPGTYEYHCARHHDDGEAGVVVVEEATGGGGDDGGDGGGEPQQEVTVSTPGDRFSPQTVTIVAGGSVHWSIAGDRHNVTFTGSAPAGGNIPDTDGATVSRTFDVVGRYDYLCTRHSGMTGAVVVQ